MSQDIFAVDFEVTPDTYVIAPGWEGRNHYHRVPTDMFTIAVNKGFQAPAVHKNLLLAEDMGMLTLHPWFEDVAGRLIFENNSINSLLPTPVFGFGKMTERFPKVHYHYNSGQTLGHHPQYTPQYEVLRGGATIASKAVQLAYLKGAKRIILVGVDLRGRKYFDGTETVSTMINDNGWWCLHKWGELIKNIVSGGVQVVSLSPTALDIPIV